jgi:hypothetical protein
MCRTIVRRASNALLISCIGLIAVGSIGHAQDSLTRQVMRQKLAHSETLLAALVTSNWSSLDRNGRALQALTTQPGWQVLQLPEFNKHTNAFNRSAAALVEAARMRDGDAALPAYNDLVSSCVGCHRYVARSRIVRAGRDDGGGKDVRSHR